MLKIQSLRQSVLLRPNPIGEIDAVRLCPRRMEHITGLDGIQVPGYVRENIRPGILNFGLRNFHRVHNAVFVDDLLHIPGNENWGMVSVGITESHRQAYKSLKDQGSLYSVVSKTLSGSSNIRVIGSILDTLQCPQDTARVIEYVSSGNTQLILLTMKENNYHFDCHFSGLNLYDPKIQADLARTDRLADHHFPRSPVGILVEGLYRRFKSADHPGVTIMSCDNIVRGGDVTRGMIHLFASQRHPGEGGFMSWLEEQVLYPNAMCDRICHTDSYPDYGSLQQIFGIRDDALLTTEDFREWVIEDQDWHTRPNGLEAIPGIRLVKNSIPFEKVKLQYNYGTRLAIACVSTAIGYSRFEDALEDSLIQNFARKLMDELSVGIDPHIIDLSKYSEKLITRISTKQLRYLLNRVVEDTSTKLKMNWQPAIESSIEKQVPCLATTIAIWAHLLARGLPIDVNLNKLESLAKRMTTSTSLDNIRPFTAAVFHTNSANNIKINEEILIALREIEFTGFRGAIAKASMGDTKHTLYGI